MRFVLGPMVLISFASAMTACGGAAPSVSSLSVRYGQEIPETDHPAVVFLGSCTGTFVSDTTLITAKHCVSTPDRYGRVGNPVRLPRLGNLRSTKVFANPRGSTCCTKHDVAVAVFEEGAAPAVVDLLGRGLTVGEAVLMVGFGGRDGDPTAGPFGVKRKGTNVVGKLEAGMIETYMPSGSGLAPGDSGGPLFVEDKFAGVASSGDGRTWSRHVDVMDAESRAFLQLAVDGGADIPGFEPTATY